MKKFIILIVLALVHQHVNAQTFFQVSHTSGSVAINGRNVTVTATSAATTYAPVYCQIAANSYYMGQNSTGLGFKYAFSSPVGRVRLVMGAQNVGEVISFYVNGSQYSISSGNILSYTGGCSFTGIPVAVNGNLEVSGTNTYANCIIEIVTPGIDSIRVHHIGSYSLGGTVYNFFFASDTNVSINMPFNDTLLCAGDTVMLPYSVDKKFNSANVFTAQLSNSSGSFGTPVTIGSRTSDTSGVITCVIPVGTVSGGGYRIRIVSSTPLVTSIDNGKDIGIGIAKPVKPIAGNNGPLCSGNTLNLTASTTTTGVSWKWTGPNSFTSSLQSPSITNAQTNRAGSYIVTAYVYGCNRKDTTNVSVIQSASPLSSGPDQMLCTGDSIKLTSSTPQTSATIAWTGPNSFSSTLLNPFIVNGATSMSGLYIVTATLNGCISRDTTNVTVSQTPVKPDANNNGPVCSGNTLSLTGTTTTTGVNWSWSGPNSFTSSAQNPSIANVQGIHAGDYIVTASIANCSTKDTTTVIVASTTGSVIASSNSPICDDDTLRLTSGGSASVVSYSWTGPNSFTSSAQNPTIIHPTTAATGDYYLSVALSGCTILDTVSVLVKPVPKGLTASGNAPVCTGDSIKLFAGSTTSGVTYLWTGPNAYSVFVQNPAIANAASINSGDYIISYLLNGCTAKDTITVAVNPKPAPVTAMVNGPVCEGSTLSLASATTTSGVTYSWIGPNSFSSTNQNPNITNAQTAASGDYIVTAALGLCNVKDTVTALVKPMPANTSASNNGPVCAGSTLSLAAGTSSTGVSYSWIGPNSFSSTQQSPNITNAQPIATGNYTVTFNLNGCSSNANTGGIVIAIPAKPTAGSNTPVCDGTTLNLTASTVPSATYTWTGPAGFSSLLQNPSINSTTPSNAGQYIVRAVNGSCYSLPDTTTVTVIPAPNVNIYPNPNDTICLGSNVTFVAVASNVGTSTSYRWMKNNVPTGATTTSYSSTGIANNDVIYCELTANGVCASPYKDSSNKLTMTVMPWLAPSVSITSNPSTPLSPYQLVQFTANATNAGTTPAYQWKRNGADVQGATSFTWGTYQLSDNDDISVVVTSSYMCPQPPTATSNLIKVTILTGVNDLNEKDKIKVYPNPVMNELIIDGAERGTVVQLFDAIGRNIYTDVINNGKQIIQTSGFPPGTYMLHLSDKQGRRSSYKLLKD